LFGCCMDACDKVVRCLCAAFFVRRFNNGSSYRKRDCWYLPITHCARADHLPALAEADDDFKCTQGLKEQGMV
jgi:hypothetical protein